MRTTSRSCSAAAPARRSPRACRPRPREPCKPRERSPGSQPIHPAGRCCRGSSSCPSRPRPPTDRCAPCRSGGWRQPPLLARRCRDRGRPAVRTGLAANPDRPQPRLRSRHRGTGRAPAPRPGRLDDRRPRLGARRARPNPKSGAISMRCGRRSTAGRDPVLAVRLAGPDGLAAPAHRPRRRRHDAARRDDGGRLSRPPIGAGDAARHFVRLADRASDGDRRLCGGAQTR